MRLVQRYEVAGEAPLLELPLYESLVPAGFPSPADDYIDLKLDLNSYLVKRPCSTYYAKVSGDSMTGAGIFDGDLIVVDRSQFPAAGKIVVVALNGEITVKRIQYQQAKILLCPENEKYQTIALDSHEGFEFYGVVIGIIRKL
ncbi:MAG: translesion error-prone DNA polymerase V autoproteolytic subunit [Cytophagales bacterium]|nr:translesion error-prone DNA polymerase V autoproteolytic subunit [Cytophagales bacterium]